MRLNNILLSIQSVAPEAVSDSTIVAKKEALISSLKTMSIDDLISRLIDGAITLGIRLLIAVVVFYFGQFIIKKLYKISSQILVTSTTGTATTAFWCNYRF